VYETTYLHDSAGKQTILSEGCRGSISEDVMKMFGLREGVCPQQYGIGLKEVWEIDPKLHRLVSAWDAR
jgi:electron-transferring-flavoprotein dehydrogenase